MTFFLRSLSAGAACLAITAGVGAQRPPRSSAATSGFDYYVLALSWAPDFCASSGGFKDPAECGPGRHLGFIVHGLWPQTNVGRAPENCPSTERPSNATITRTAGYIPSAGLIQHEWRAHGTCSGQSPDGYFALLRKARDGVQLPAAFVPLSKTLATNPRQVEQQFAQANPSLLATSIRATCSSGELQEVRICLDKTLRSRPCTSSVGGCNASKITVLPVR